jgi:hypothetical protein
MPCTVVLLKWLFFMPFFHFNFHALPSPPPRLETLIFFSFVHNYRIAPRVRLNWIMSSSFAFKLLLLLLWHQRGCAQIIEELSPGEWRILIFPTLHVVMCVRLWLSFHVIALFISLNMYANIEIASSWYVHINVFFWILVVFWFLNQVNELWWL